MRLTYTAKRLPELGRALVVARRLATHERWTRERLLEFQRERLSTLVEHAVSRSPFYRDLYGGRSRVELDELPVVTKEMVMEHFDRVVTDRRLTLSDLQGHLQRISRDEYHLGEYRVLATGGSTGVLGVFVYGRREWSTQLAGFLRSAAFLGFGPRLPRRLRVAAMGAPSPLHQSNRVATTLTVGLYRSLRLPATTPLETLVQELNAFRPEAISAYPSVAALLAVEQLEGRLRIRPRVVSTVGEVRLDEMTETIRGAWGVEPFNMYSATESGVLACDCREHRGLHAFEDLHIVEVVDEENRPVPLGVPGHRLLLTNLYNYTLPLIRYEISDIVTLAPDPCPCGRPFRLFRAVEGRSDDILYLSGEDGRPVAVHPIHLRSPIALFGDVRQYQVVHDRHGVDVLVVLKHGARGDQTAAKIRDTLSAALRRLGVAAPAITVRVVDRIERESGPSAKFKLVRSRVQPEHRAFH